MGLGRNLSQMAAAIVIAKTGAGEAVKHLDQQNIMPESAKVQMATAEQLNPPSVLDKVMSEIGKGAIATLEDISNGGDGMADDLGDRENAKKVQDRISENMDKMFNDELEELPVLQTFTVAELVNGVVGGLTASKLLSIVNHQNVRAVSNQSMFGDQSIAEIVVERNSKIAFEEFHNTMQRMKDDFDQGIGIDKLYSSLTSPAIRINNDNFVQVWNNYQKIKNSLNYQSIANIGSVEDTKPNVVSSDAGVQNNVSHVENIKPNVVSFDTEVQNNVSSVDKYRAKMAKKLADYRGGKVSAIDTVEGGQETVVDTVDANIDSILKNTGIDVLESSKKKKLINVLKELNVVTKDLSSLHKSVVNLYIKHLLNNTVKQGGKEIVNLVGAEMSKFDTKEKKKEVVEQFEPLYKKLQIVLEKYHEAK